MDTAPRRRDDTQPHLTCFHMRAAVSGGGGEEEHSRSFSLPLSPVAALPPRIFMQHAAAPLILCLINEDDKRE